MIHLFVYGTLMPGQESYHLCADRVLEVQPAIAIGRLYHLPLGYPALTLAGTSAIYGYVLTFSDQEILHHLDQYENNAPEVLDRDLASISPESVIYQRQQIPTFAVNRTPICLAWAYTMTEQQIHLLQGELLPDGRWSGEQTYRIDSPAGR